MADTCSIAVNQDVSRLVSELHHSWIKERHSPVPGQFGEPITTMVTNQLPSGKIGFYLVEEDFLEMLRQKDIEFEEM